MKKFLVLIATVSLALGACERHPASQLPTESEGVAKEGSGKSDATQEKPSNSRAFSERHAKNLFPAEFLIPVLSEKSTKED